MGLYEKILNSKPIDKTAKFAGRHIGRWAAGSAALISVWGIDQTVKGLDKILSSPAKQEAVNAAYKANTTFGDVISAVATYGAKPYAAYTVALLGYGLYIKIAKSVANTPNEDIMRIIQEPQEA